MSAKDQIKLHWKAFLRDHKMKWHIKGIIRAILQKLGGK
jgi:hypothetical protein